MGIQHCERRRLALQRIEAEEQGGVFQNVGVVADVEGMAIIHDIDLAGGE